MQWLFTRSFPGLERERHDHGHWFAGTLPWQAESNGRLRGSHSQSIRLVTSMSQFDTADPSPELEAKKVPATPKARPTTRSRSAQSPLETYLREINETALLSAQEELELADQIVVLRRGEIIKNATKNQITREDILAVVSV